MVLIGDFNALISEIVLNTHGTIVIDQWFGYIINIVAKHRRWPVKPQNKQKCYSWNITAITLRFIHFVLNNYVRVFDKKNVSYIIEPSIVIVRV